LKFVPLHLAKALMEGRRIAAKVEPQFPDAVAWVWVAPYRAGSQLQDVDENMPRLYRVQHFEVKKELIDGEYDISDEELLHNEEHCALKSLEEVDAILGQLVGDPSKFKLLADYPDYFPF
jgi:hypothetical protein